ncbi:ATP-binding protein [Sphingomonas pituitosa]|uniref:ATP-binding protein n=1 Tax=Sphingomonas pituitosa TaxID=99597 RepID=UPI000B15CC19|nr:ATP-binding protein [Sphingomonas pituitosa]
MPTSTNLFLRVVSFLCPRRWDWLLLALYAVGFALAHWVAGFWGGRGFYSLWFPAAGLRLALLWRAGPRLLPWVALVELASDAASGLLWFGMPDLAMAVFGVVRPVLAYGLTVAVIRWLAGGTRANVLIAPMPFGLATFFAPFVAALFALPQALYLPELTGVRGAREVVESLAAFTVGDLLGVLSVGPPVLWIGDLVTGRDSPPKPPPPAAALEASLVLGAALAAGNLLQQIGLGDATTLTLLAVVWIGMRFGRGAAWIAIALTLLLTLHRSAGALSTGDRLVLHLHLASLAVVGYLAGSFAEAQRRARRDLERRDRLLFQAERLKTLRAMSVAVIHEISQPLSTLAIEARHLHAITRDADPEVAASSALIDRKATTLAGLVRRLRRFGGRAADEPSPLPVAALIESVAALAAPEAKAAGVALSIAPIDPDLVVLGQEVELAQAIINLLRNAIQACEDGRVELKVSREASRARIVVANRCTGTPHVAEGMGVGTHIARAILEAHGGTLVRERLSNVMRATVTLPRFGEAV